MKYNHRQAKRSWNQNSSSQINEQASLNNVEQRIFDSQDTIGNEKKYTHTESFFKLIKQESQQQPDEHKLPEASPSIPTKRKAEIMRQSISNNRKSTLPSLKVEYQMSQESIAPPPASSQLSTNLKRRSTFFIYMQDLNEMEDLTKKKRIVFTKQISRIERFKNIIIVYPFMVIPMKSLFKQLWDLVITITLCWCILYLPWELAFPEDIIPYHNLFLLTVFSIDLFISFRTSYYNEDQDEIIDNKLMFLNYAKSPYFILDVLSTIPFDLIDITNNMSTYSISIFKILKLIRLLRLTRIFAKIKSETFQIAGTILKYVFVLLIVLHWESLLWWTLVNRTDESNLNNLNQYNTWLPIIYHVLGSSSSLDTSQISMQITGSELIPKHIKYIYTLYSMIMLVLGGEVTPVTSIQGFEATLFAFIGQLTFAIIFANMSKALFLIQQQNQQNENIREQFELIMQQMKLPKSTKDTVNEYINFCIHKKIIFNTDLNEFNDLSLSLQQELSLVVNKSIIYDTPLFSELEAYEISLITSKLVTRVLMPNEVVFDVGDVICEMFFIVKGVVKMTKNGDEPNQKKKYLLSEGEHFGEYGVMQHWRCDYKVEATTFTITLVLKKSVLENIIAQAPAMQQRLNLGQKLYKFEEKNRFFNNFRDLDIFEGLTEQEMTTLYISYIENVNVNPQEIILVPDELIQGLYIILDGKVHLYRENSKFLKVNQIYSHNSNWNNDIFYNSLDDYVYEKIDQHQKIGQLQEIEDRVHLYGELNSGQYFGLIDHNVKRNLKNENIVLMSSQYSVKLGIINANIMSQLAEDDILLYDKLKINLNKINRLFPKDIKIINQYNIQSDDNLSDYTPSKKKKLSFYNKDFDTKMINLKQQINQINKEINDIHRKIRVIQPPMQSLIFN